ncbi:MAG: hypothetical protein P8180_11590 [Gammaproteobacteria bacterium]
MRKPFVHRQLLAFAGPLLLAGVAWAGQSMHLGVTPSSGSYVSRANVVGHEMMGAAGPTMNILFDRLDTNSNQSIDRQEAKASKLISTHFAEIDTNHDLQISPSEFAAFEQRWTRAQEKDIAQNAFR